MSQLRYVSFLVIPAALSTALLVGRVLLLPISFSFRAKASTDPCSYQARVSLISFGREIKLLSVPPGTRKKRLPGPKSRFVPKASGRVTDLLPFIRRAIRHRYYYCEEARVSLTVGTGDAAETALISGSVRALLPNLIRLVGGPLGLGETRPLVRILPEYRRAVLETDITCIYRIHLGKIILYESIALVAGHSRGGGRRCLNTPLRP